MPLTEIDPGVLMKSDPVGVWRGAKGMEVQKKALPHVDTEASLA
jgi:hypothetical protein